MERSGTEVNSTGSAPTPMKLTNQTGQTVSAVTKAVTQSDSPTRQELLRLIQQAAETSSLVSKVGVAAEAEVAAEVEAEADFGDELSADEIFQRAETARKEAEAALASAAVAATAVTAAVAVAVAKEVEAARARAAWARAAAVVAEALRVEQVAALQAAEKVAAAEATEAAAAETHNVAMAALHDDVDAKNETLNVSAYQHPVVAAPQEAEKAKAAVWAAPVADAPAAAEMSDSAAEMSDSAYEKAAVEKEAAEWVAPSLYEASSLQQASSLRSSTEDYEDVGAEDETPNAKDETPNAEDETPNAKDETPNAKDETPNAKDWWEKASPVIESAFDKVRSAVSDASPIIAAKVKSFLGDHFGIDAERLTAEEAAASAVDKAVTKAAAAEAATAEAAADAAAAAAAAAVAAAAAKEAEEARAAMALEVIAAAMAEALRAQAAWQVAEKASAAAEAEAAESAVAEAAAADEAAPKAKATSMATKYVTAVGQEASPRSMMSHLDGVVVETSLSPAESHPGGAVLGTDLGTDSPAESHPESVPKTAPAESHPEQRVSAQVGAQDSASRLLRDACALMLLGLGVALLWMACAEVLPPYGALSWARAGRALDDTWGAASGAFAHARARIGQLSWSDVVDGADAAAVALSSLAQTLAKRGALTWGAASGAFAALSSLAQTLAKRGALARASLLIAGRAQLCAQLDLLCEAARRDAAEREAAAAYLPQLVEFASKVWTEARSGLTSALS